MKKKLFSFLAVFGIMIAGTASASLYNWYQEQGLNLPSVADRVADATMCGIDDYTGTYAQNIALEECMTGHQDYLGATPTPTSSAAVKYVEAPDFYAYSPAVSGDTSITLNNLEDIYGNTLTMDDFGDIGYGRIDPDGSEVSESFTFSGVTANSDGTYSLTGVKSVLAKYPYTQTSGLTRSHSINAIVRFTNTASFYDNFANKENDEIVDGDWEFTAFPYFTTGTTLPDANGEFATKYYVDTVGAGGFTAVNVSTTQGLQVYGTSPETVGVNVSSTMGMTIGTDGSIYQKANTNEGLEQDSDGIAVNFDSTLVTTTAGALGVNATSTPTASKIPIADGSGKLDDGWLNTTAFNIISSGGFTAGEDLDANDAVRQGIEDQTTDPRIFISQTTADQTTNSASILDDTSKLEAQSFTTDSSQTERILSVTLGLKETGANGNETFTVRLYDDNGGEPGSLITSKQLVVTLLSGAVTYPTFEFATPQELATNTVYWISVESDRTGGRDADVSYNSTSVYSDGNRARSTNGGSSWTDAPTNDLYFVINYTDTDGRIYKTNALSQNVSDAMIGYTNTSSSAADTGLTINHIGVVDGFTGLTTGTTYYLSDTSGTISDSNGTVTKKIGVALSTTKLLSILDF